MRAADIIEGEEYAAGSPHQFEGRYAEPSRVIVLDTAHKWFDPKQHNWVDHSHLKDYRGVTTDLPTRSRHWDIPTTAPGMAVAIFRKRRREEPYWEPTTMRSQAIKMPWDEWEQITYARELTRGHRQAKKLDMLNLLLGSGVEIEVDDIDSVRDRVMLTFRQVERLVNGTGPVVSSVPEWSRKRHVERVAQLKGVDGNAFYDEDW